MTVDGTLAGAARRVLDLHHPARQNHVKSSETCGQCHAIRHNSKKELWNAEGLHYWPGEEIESKAPAA